MPNPRHGVAPTPTNPNSAQRHPAQRYYGYYSSKARGQRKKKESPIQIKDSPRKKIQKKAWAVMIQQVFEIDPLRCVRCGGEMRLIAFISRNQQDIINTLTDCLNIEMADLEERTRGPPRWLAIQQAQEFVQAHPDAYPEENLDPTAHINEEAYFLNPP